MNLEQLEKNLKYRFQNKILLKTALTHSTYAYESNERDVEDNERLEFLGDSVLSMIISLALYNFHDYKEGKMTKIRSSVVRQESLAKLAKELEISKYMLLGQGEEKTGGRLKYSNAEDCIEAIIGAIFLDSDFETVNAVVLSHFLPIIEEAISGNVFFDYKSRLLELLQANENKPDIQFELISATGPAHAMEFTTAVVYKKKRYPSYTASSKRRAEQGAAKNFLELYKPEANVDSLLEKEDKA